MPHGGREEVNVQRSPIALQKLSTAGSLGWLTLILLFGLLDRSFLAILFSIQKREATS